MDRTELILYYMNVFLQYEQRSSEPAAKFKVRAYENAITAVKNFDAPIITESDVKALEGIGDKIRKKMLEIVRTGKLEEAESLEKVDAVRSELMNIYGVGTKKADDFIKNYGITSIADLQLLALNNSELFTKAQLLGLAFYSDLIQRIPRIEMIQHENFLRNFVKKFNKKMGTDFNLTIVGSYRRGLQTSGDIDVLLSYENMTYEKASEKYRECVDELTDMDYMLGTLSFGKAKFLGICSLESSEELRDETFIARRIDILLTPPEELAYTLLYFTGSKEFNTEFRKVAISRGYSLNEHKLSKLVPVAPDVPFLKTERDVFDFLRIKYQSPEQRSGDVETN